MPETLIDTLVWEPVAGTWMGSNLASSPTARLYASMAYDTARARVVLYGGFPLDPAIWEWDGANWTGRGGTGSGAPPPRQNSPVAYDTRRHKLLMFGGVSATSAYLDDLWEWDGSGAGVWTSLAPTPRPASWPVARTGPGLVYDQDRGVFVLFGGTSSTGPAQDLWDWDPLAGTWTNRTPAAPSADAWPPITGGISLVYDVGRSRSVLFDSDVSFATDPHHGIWEWDGRAGAWTNRTPAPLPAAWPLPTTGAALAYDPDRGKIVMSCGRGPSATAADRQTWEWDGDSGTWTDRTIPAPWPRAHQDFVFAYDSRRAKAILFGGLAPLPRADLWEWTEADGQWTDRTPDLPPKTWPPTESAASTGVYDDDRGKLIVFGLSSDPGVTLGSGDEVWEWDGSAATWTNRTPSPKPDAWPSAYQALAAYDSHRKRVLLFGPAGTWEWDAAAATWQDRAPSSQPSPRLAAAMAYDSKRGSVWLFGGRDQVGTALGDLWEWNGATGAWSNQTPTSLPATWPDARSGHGLVYGAAGDRIVLFGGDPSNGDQPSSDTWEWDGAKGTWQRYPAPPSSAGSSNPSWPPARTDLGLIYDSTRGVVLLFGGLTVVGTAPLPDRRIWQWGM